MIPTRRKAKPDLEHATMCQLMAYVARRPRLYWGFLSLLIRHVFRRVWLYFLYWASGHSVREMLALARKRRKRQAY